jgi:alpha-tubulin suppressor-like RCC1 family protein
VPLAVIVPALRDHQAVTVAAGGDHSLVVTSAGRVFAFGRNDSYQLGVALASGTQCLAGGARIGVDKLMQEGADERQVGPEPVQIAGLRWKSVLQISCGDAHNLARCVGGDVYAWGLGGSGRLGLGHFRSVQQPAKVDLGGKPCVAVAAGYYHSLALLEGGELMAWGSGDCGQLGTGQCNSEPLPTSVKPLDAGHTCASIAAGEYHSLAISHRAGCFTWGLNNAGQLGTGDTQRRAVPTNPSALVAVRVRRAACGATFCIAVCESTEVLAWGGNEEGCLGLGDIEPRHSPTPIVALRGQVLEKVVCGGRFVAAINQDGKVLVWGSNSNGNLCLGDNKSRYAPVTVPGSMELEIDDIACGYSHTVLVSKLEQAEVQARQFYQQGLLHMDDRLMDGFCFYNWSRSARYYPHSVARSFYSRHGVPMAADVITTVSVATDRRLMEVVERSLIYIYNTIVN